MVVWAHALAERVLLYHWMVTTQTTFCGRKRRLKTEPAREYRINRHSGRCRILQRGVASQRSARS